MYFKRKIDLNIEEWLNSSENFPALVVGIRQCGKTETIKEVIKGNGYNVVEVNFWTNLDYRLDFDGNLDVDNIISILSLRFPKKSFYS